MFWAVRSSKEEQRDSGWDPREWRETRVWQGCGGTVQGRGWVSTCDPPEWNRAWDPEKGYGVPGARGRAFWQFPNFLFFFFFILLSKQKKKKRKCCCLFTLLCWLSHGSGMGNDDCAVLGPLCATCPYFGFVCCLWLRFLVLTIPPITPHLRPFFWKTVALGNFKALHSARFRYFITFMLSLIESTSH